MKKNIFIILTTTLSILILLYFYDKKEFNLNKKYYNETQNIHIEYPFFNNKTIDNYINNYLNLYLEKKSLKEEQLFIDYDYLEEQNYLTFYIYEQNGNQINESTKTLNINPDTKNISIPEKTKNTIIDYDSYYQKLIDQDKPMIALTFDDGPNHNTIKILNILEKYGTKATFFILGTNITNNEEIIKKMNELNMEIGNHMYSHKLITKMSSEKIAIEIKKVDDQIYNIINEYPTLIRPSYGSYNKKICDLVDRPIIIWNIDTLDWKYHNSKRIANNVIKKVKDGDIILMHDIYSATANSLEIIIPKLLEMNYQFVTVSELLYYKQIEKKAGKIYSNAN